MTEKSFYWTENVVEPQTYEEILENYRKYVGDPKAEFPPVILEELKRQGKVKQSV